MYYIIYVPLYLLSLLPFAVLYFLSDYFYALTYYVIRYRRKLVLNNLAIAFPEKTAAERKKIAKQFYKNFVDTFIETIKMMSITDKEFEKRSTIDIEPINKIAGTVTKIHFHSGHQMNWEYGSGILAKRLQVPLVGVYMPVENKALDKIFYNLRSKYNLVLISAEQFRTRMHNVFKTHYGLGLIADQKPASGDAGYWLNFFSKPAAFVRGPDKMARRNNPAIVFVKFTRIKRGYFHYDTILITVNGNELNEGDLTNKYRDFLEESIRLQPDNYLWSHHRWKYDYKPGYKNRWIDHKSAAPE